MKKQLLNLGKALSSAEQKEVNGGLSGIRPDSCSLLTLRYECLSDPRCAWNGTSCYTDVPYIEDI